MSSDNFPLISDPHAPPPPPHPDTSSATVAGDYYTSFSDPGKSGSGAPATPSSKRSNPQPYYYNTNATSKKHKPGGGGDESDPTTAAVDYRKDREEWSDAAILCLLEAYTEKYRELHRGNLRGRDWEEVAEAVSDNNMKKSVEQCKNKIDNLKKRYKVELQRITNGNYNTGSGSCGGSNWHWFKHIEAIVGNSSGSKGAGGGSVSAGGGGGGGGGECDGGSGVSNGWVSGGAGSGCGNGTVVVRQGKRYYFGILLVLLECSLHVLS